MRWCAGIGRGSGLPTLSLLVWEYPREAPDGDQLDLVEVTEIADSLIQHHRIYWGWLGTQLLTKSAVAKSAAEKLRKIA
jgi:hypothetical protein